MYSLKSIFTLLFVVLACATTAFAKKKEEEDAALRDLHTGMAGLKEAASNPALLAQLMRDMAVSSLQWCAATEHCYEWRWLKLSLEPL